MARAVDVDCGGGGRAWVGGDGGRRSGVRKLWRHGAVAAMRREAPEDDVVQYLAAVDVAFNHLSHGSTGAARARVAVPLAMVRLEEELHHLMVRHAIPIDPTGLFFSLRHLSLESMDDLDDSRPALPGVLPMLFFVAAASCLLRLFQAIILDWLNMDSYFLITAAFNGGLEAFLHRPERKKRYGQDTASGKRILIILEMDLISEKSVLSQNFSACEVELLTAPSITGQMDTCHWSCTVDDHATVWVRWASICSCRLSNKSPTAIQMICPGSDEDHLNACQEQTRHLIEETACACNIKSHFYTLT